MSVSGSRGIRRFGRRYQRRGTSLGRPPVEGVKLWFGSLEVDMSDTDSDVVSNGYTAAVSGDIEPLVALFHDDLEWRGTERGVLWWRHAPS